MTIDHLAVLGIVIFGFMAVMNLFTSLRSFKRHRRATVTRIRRLISGPEAARAVAESIVHDIEKTHQDDISRYRDTGNVSPPLETAFEKGREYYLTRVEAIHTELFSKVVDELILQKKP